MDTGSAVVVVDALFDRPNPAYAAPPPELLGAISAGVAPFSSVDLALVTHDHPDHFAPSVVDRFLVDNPRARLLAPSDAVESLKAFSGAWPEYADRVIPVALGVGDTSSVTVAGVRVKAVRTLHSGGREVPMNLMYLLDMDGVVVFHEGDPYPSPDRFQTVMEGWPSPHLAVVHYWLPFDEGGRRILEEILDPGFVALGHYPLNPESLPPEAFAGLDETYLLLDRPGIGSEVNVEPRTSASTRRP